VILEEARGEARAVTREARAEREQLLAESRRIRALLNAALDALDEAEEPSLDTPPLDAEAA